MLLKSSNAEAGVADKGFPRYGGREQDPTGMGFGGSREGVCSGSCSRGAGVFSSSLEQQPPEHINKPMEAPDKMKPRPSQWPTADGLDLLASAKAH